MFYIDGQYRTHTTQSHTLTHSHHIATHLYPVPHGPFALTHRAWWCQSHIYTQSPPTHTPKQIKIHIHEVIIHTSHSHPHQLRHTLYTLTHLHIHFTYTHAPLSCPPWTGWRVPRPTDRAWWCTSLGARHMLPSRRYLLICMHFRWSKYMRSNPLRHYCTCSHLGDIYSFARCSLQHIYIHLHMYLVNVLTGSKSGLTTVIATHACSISALNKSFECVSTGRKICVDDNNYTCREQLGMVLPRCCHVIHCVRWNIRHRIVLCGGGTDGGVYMFASSGRGSIESWIEGMSTCVAYMSICVWVIEQILFFRLLYL